MDILRLIFGWRWRVRRIRKKWDRLREKALTKKGQQRKIALEKLDIIEKRVVILEEQNVGRIARARISKEIEIALAEIKAILKAEPEEISTYQALQLKKQAK